MTSRPVRGLRGERVYLRPLEPEDADLVSELVRGRPRPQAHGRSADQPGTTPPALRPTRSPATATRSSDSSSAGSMTTRPSGATDLFDIDRTNGHRARSGSRSATRRCGARGSGTDAVNAVVDFAFGELRMERVWLDTDADNLRAQAAYARRASPSRAGSATSGSRTAAIPTTSGWRMLRDEWLALPRPRSWELAGRRPTIAADRGRLGRREAARGRPAAMRSDPAGVLRRHSGGGRRRRRATGPSPPRARCRRCRRTAMPRSADRRAIVALFVTIAVVLLPRVAVVRTGRRDRVVRDRHRHDPVDAGSRARSASRISTTFAS